MIPFYNIFDTVLNLGPSHRTFKSYLISWYCFVLSITLVGFSVVLYFSISNYLEATVDQHLGTLANIEAIAAFEMESKKDAPAEPHEHVSPMDKPLQSKFGISHRFVSIFRSDRSILSMFSTSKTIKMPSNMEILDSLTGEKRVFETRYVKGEFLRIIYLPIVQKGEMTYIVQLGVITTRIVDIQQRLKRTLFFLDFVVLAASLLTGYFLAQKAVRPIIKVSDTAMKIDENNLDERLSVSASFLELERLVDVFNDMLERIELSFRTRKQFIASVSHEVRSPLTAMKLNIDVALRKEREPEEYVTALTSLQEETERLVNLFDSLLLLSQADNKRSVLRFEKFSVCDFVKESVDLKQIEAAQARVELVCENCVHIDVVADRTMLRQLLNNLVDNAIKYSYPMRKIFVSTWVADGICFMAVKDSGVGISEKDQERVFDRFYRVDKSRSRETGGNGLGLSIVQDIARMHNGSVSLESRTDCGTIFTFSWPVSPPESALPWDYTERRARSR